MSCLHRGCIPLKTGSQFCCPTPRHPPLPVTTGHPRSSGSALAQHSGPGAAGYPAWPLTLPTASGSVAAPQGCSTVSWSPPWAELPPSAGGSCPHLANICQVAPQRELPAVALPAALPARPGSRIRGAGTAVIPGSARRQLILTRVLPTARTSASWQCCGSAELVGRWGTGVSCPLPLAAVPSLPPLPTRQPRSEGLAAAQPGAHRQCCSPSSGPGCGIVPAAGSFHHLLPSAVQPICCFGLVFPLAAPSLSPACPSLGLGCWGSAQAG